MALRLGWNQPATIVEAQLVGQPLSIMEFESPSAAVIAEPVPLTSRHMVWVVSGLVFLLVAISAIMPVDIVITASGKVVSTAATVVLQPLDESIIKSINVRTGQLVHKGDLLAVLDPTLTQADVNAYKQQIAGLVPELERLQDEKDHKEYVPKDPKDPNQALQLKLFEQRKAEVLATNEQYNQQISSLEQQIAGNLSAAQYYRERLGMANDVETLRRQEEQMQVGSKLNSLLAADERVQMEAGMQTSVAAAQAEQATLKSTIGQRDAAQATFDAATSQSINDQSGLLTTAQQNLDKAVLHGGLVEMRAPSDAMVLQVEKLSEGSVLQPGEQFIQLSPLDKPLQIEAYVSGTDSGWVQTGDYADIKFDTFMYSEYGMGTAHVTSLSIDSFNTPSGGGTTGPIIVSTSTADPSNAVNQATSMSPAVSVFYIANLKIDKLMLRHTPKDFRLVPGMPVSADIKVGTHTYLQYALARVEPVFHDAMREP